MMGGALGMAARKSGAAVRVIGVADSQDTIQRALAKGAVDDATLDLRAAVQDAEMVILCTPVRTILDAAAAVLPVCREETVVTDIGSSKAVIVHSIENFIAKTKCKAFFVGSHPITGSEKKGIEASDQVVVSGAPCVITPTQQTNIDAYRKADEFWKALGMRTVRLSPEEHDTVLARSSHVPHLIAAALIGDVGSASAVLGLLPVLALALGIALNRVGHAELIAFCLALGTASAFAAPARDGLLSSLAGANLMRAVTAITIFQFGGQFVGTLAGGWIAESSVLAALAVPAALLAFAAYAPRHLPPPPPAAPSSIPSR